MSRGASLAAQWLRLWASNSGEVGSIPGWGTKIPHATWHSKKSYIYFFSNILKEEESVPEIPGLARLETMNTHFQLVKDKIDIAFA